MPFACSYAGWLSSWEVHQLAGLGMQHVAATVCAQPARCTPAASRYNQLLNPVILFCSYCVLPAEPVQGPRGPQVVCAGRAGALPHSHGWRSWHPHPCGEQQQQRQQEQEGAGQAGNRVGVLGEAATAAKT